MLNVKFGAINNLAQTQTSLACAGISDVTHGFLSLCQYQSGRLLKNFCNMFTSHPIDFNRRLHEKMFLKYFSSFSDSRSVESANVLSHQ